jgi:hypothetical protein
MHMHGATVISVAKDPIWVPTYIDPNLRLIHHRSIPINGERRNSHPSHQVLNEGLLRGVEELALGHFVHYRFDLSRQRAKCVSKVVSGEEMVSLRRIHSEVTVSKWSRTEKQNLAVGPITPATAQAVLS